MMADAQVPNLKFHHDGFEFNNGELPTHDFSVDKRLKKYSSDSKVVFVRRGPKDVIVSLYHQVTGRFKDFFNYPPVHHSLEEGLRRF
jgi:hypothetical protein